MSNERRFLSIVCDDIRHEVSNKQSLIGCYTGDMIVPSFPTLLPKICVYSTAVTPATDPFQSLTVKVYQGEILIGELPIETTSLSPTSSAKLSYSVGMVFSPLTFEKESCIRVEIETERETVCTEQIPVIAAQTL